MTDIAEGVAIVMRAMDEDQRCEHKPPKTSWKCNLDGDGRRLGNNLVSQVGVPRPATPASLLQVTERSWPSQAHHLIPWQQLRKHAVSQWLAAAPPVVPAKLTDDNSYDVDHGLNGKFMPYASALPEWASASAAKKVAIANRVMAVAGIQLHQGRHSKTKYAAGEAGYKTRVDEYLTAIHVNSLAHSCEECAAKKTDGKVAPRKNVVRFVDGASARLEVEINVGKIYVSKRADSFAASGGVMG